MAASLSTQWIGSVNREWHREIFYSQTCHVSQIKVNIVSQDIVAASLFLHTID